MGKVGFSHPHDLAITVPSNVPDTSCVNNHHDCTNDASSCCPNLECVDVDVGGPMSRRACQRISTDETEMNDAGSSLPLTTKEENISIQYDPKTAESKSSNTASI